MSSWPARRSARASSSRSHSPAQTAIRRTSPIPIASTFIARTHATRSRSRTARTCASGCTWRGWRRTPPWSAFLPGSPASGSIPTGPRRPAASCFASRRRSTRSGEFDAARRNRQDLGGTGVPPCEMAEATGTQAIDRAAQLLVRVVESVQPPSVGELAERAGLPKSTTSRLVGALERQGLVQRLGERGRLTAGPVLLRYANRDVSSTLVELAAPSLRRLADASGETINLAVRGVDGVEHLAQEDTAHYVGVTDWVGRRVPFDLAANGKCFLAFGGTADVTPELARVRARGYATSVDELELGLS